MKLLLASTSPRRKMLLENLGFDLQIIGPDIDESILPLEQPDELVLRLSKEKAQTVEEKNIVILAADTIVVCENKILGKPIDKNEAREFLKLLSNRFHEVLTGFTLRKNDRAMSKIVRTKVWFRPLSEKEIESYISTKEPYDKAGAYAIQGPTIFVDRIEGSFTNVIGLPVKEVLESLETFSNAFN